MNASSMLPGGDDHDQDDVPASAHHVKAADHHEAAARAHREAGRSVQPEKMAHHAQIAHGHAVKAMHEGKMAACQYCEGKR